MHCRDGHSLGVPETLFESLRTKLIPFLLCSLILLPACEQRTICTGSRIESPSDNCAAYYYETDFHSKKRLSQALLACTFDGRAVSGNLVSFHDEYPSPMNFIWVSDFELSIFIDPNSNFPNRQLGTSRTEDFLGREIRINFLESDDEIYVDIGCSEL